MCVLVHEGDVAVRHELARVVVLDVVMPRLAWDTGGCRDVNGRLVVYEDGGRAGLREAYRSEELAEPHDRLETGRKPVCCSVAHADIAAASDVTIAISASLARA